MTETKVELLNFNNNFNDLTVVNAARVSFNKQKEVLDLQDEKLINYLVSHKHWTPAAHPHATISVPRLMIDYSRLITKYKVLAGLSFYINYDNDTMEITGSLWGLLQLAKHLQSGTILDLCDGHCPVTTQAFIDNTITPSDLKDYINDSSVVLLDAPTYSGHDVFSFRITAPIYIARQLVKHTEKLVWNEISGRYVPLDIGVEYPSEWLSPPVKAKQGSGSTPVTMKDVEYEDVDGEIHYFNYYDIVEFAKDWYDANDGVIANEQRRKILPLSTYTSWIWTGIRDAFDNVIDLRCSEDAPKEPALVAQGIREHL